MNYPAISVQGLGKRFSRSLKRAMFYGMQDLIRVGLIPSRHRSAHLAARMNDAADNPVSPVLHEGNDGLRRGEFWALRDVTFDVQKGECLGVIGHNGAGKSTLFSILSGIYGPTTGTIDVRGRLQALISLGAGFHPMLSGRENIYINAAILGMTGREIDRVIEDIINFSEIRDFIDMPIKNYSSGMLVRLGFSVAIHMKPQVLLIDEVLAVGDLSFQNKSFDKLQELIRSGITVVFVSHSIRAVETICSRVLWLDHGRLRMAGATNDVTSAYVKDMERAVPPSRKMEQNKLYPIQITKVETLDAQGRPAEEFAWRAPIRFRFHYQARERVEAPYFCFCLRRPGRENKDFASVSMFDDGLQWSIEPGQGSIDCTIEPSSLALGQYEALCAIMRKPTSGVGQKYHQDWFTGALFWIRGSVQEIRRPGLLPSMALTLSPMLVEHTWSRGEA